MAAFDMDFVAAYRQEAFLKEAEHDRLVRLARKVVRKASPVRDGSETGFVAWALGGAERRGRSVERRAA